MGNVVKGDCKPEDLSALSRIMGQPTSAVSFGASTLGREEIEQIPQEYRGPHVEVYETLGDGIKPESQLTGPYADPLIYFGWCKPS